MNAISRAISPLVLTFRATGKQLGYAIRTYSHEYEVSRNQNGDRYIKIPELDFELHVSRRANGEQFLHFPFMAISDIHLGTRQSRAKRLNYMLKHIGAKRIDLVGDIIDGEHLMQKGTWHFAEGHKEILADFLRKAGQGTEIYYLPGNHDVAIRNQTTLYTGKDVKLGNYLLRSGKKVLHHNLCGKTIAGVIFAETIGYTDPKGRRFKSIHGDQFDDVLFGRSKGALYHAGSMAYDALIDVDERFQRIPRCDNISLAAIGKKATKTVINQFLGVRRAMMKAVDDDATVDGMIYGHSHMAEIGYTVNGKLLINDGCCTEHVQATVHDRDGNWALLEWHKDRLIIKAENGQNRTIYWQDIELGEFREEPRIMRDQYTQQTEAICRLMQKLWPSKERQFAQSQAETLRRDPNRKQGDLVIKPTPVISKADAKITVPQL